MSDGASEPAAALDQFELLPPLRAMFGTIEIEIVDWDQQVLTLGGTSGAAVARLTGKARVAGQETPWSLIRKKVFAPASEPPYPSAAAGLSSVDYWKREWLLYQSGLFDHLPHGLAAPRAFYIAEGPDGYSLWTEVAQDAGAKVWPVTRFGTAAYHMGLLHGTYLAGQPLPGYPWLSRDILRQRARLTVIRRDKLDELRQHPNVLRGWPDDVAEGILQIWQEQETFFRVLQQLPFVFHHGDFSRKNLFARYAQNGEPETVAIDWGYGGIGCIGEDLACLVGSSALMHHVAPGRWPELDEVAFDGYVQGLHDAGWRGDTRRVRQAYVAAIALRMSFTPILEEMALTPKGKQRLEEIVGYSTEEITDNCLALRRFIIQRADEARQLMALLP